MKHCNIFPGKKQYCPWHCCQQRSYLIRQGQQYGYYYNSEIVVVLIGVINSCHVAIGKEDYIVQQFATSSLICERVIRGKKLLTEQILIPQSMFEIGSVPSMVPQAGTLYGTPYRPLYIPNGVRCACLVCTAIVFLLIPLV